MNYSFRKKNKTVKYVVLHYTGMESLQLAYKKLNSLSSDVSCHYLISRNGLIYNLLCPQFKAWHAGKSKWHKTSNLNDESIGIELENKGHDHGYQNFTLKQYASLRKLSLFLKKNFYISNNDFLFHSDIAPNRKKDPGEKFNFNKIAIKRNKAEIKNFKFNKKDINKLLKLYGFHNYYISRYRKDCIIAVKRSLNYKMELINSKITNIFLKDFYNSIFK